MISLLADLRLSPVPSAFESFTRGHFLDTDVSTDQLIPFPSDGVEPAGASSLPPADASNLHSRGPSHHATHDPGSHDNFIFGGGAPTEENGHALLDQDGGHQLSDVLQSTDASGQETPVGGVERRLLDGINLDNSADVRQVGQHHAYDETHRGDGLYPAEHHDWNEPLGNLSVPLATAGFAGVAGLHQLRNAVLFAGGTMSKMFGLSLIGYLAFQAMQANMMQEKRDGRPQQRSR
mmetsp:Transcript_37669/g.100220  ORF Transcript_37669/g.100220 Transcript_37669/m.100220 type:complete len:235 (-) Transcript_37669:131-835(-)